MTHEHGGPSVAVASSFEDDLARRSDQEQRERRWIRVGLAAAALVHAAVFVVSWPTLANTAAPPEDERVVVYRLQPFEFQPPDMRRIDVTVPRSVRIPVPDPDPHDPELVDRPDERPYDHNLDLDQLVVAAVEPTGPAPPPREVVVGVDIAPPEVVHRVTPRYPEAAIRIRLQGAVIVELVIDPRGEVESATLLRGMAMGLSEAALEAVRQWRFRPSTIDGRPVHVRYVLTVHFRLE